MHNETYFNPSALKNPRLNHFVAFMCYVVTFCLTLFVIPIGWSIFLKISGLYLYLTCAVYLYIYITTPFVVVFYLALIFQAACYDVETFSHDPRALFINQAYKPKIVNAFKSLVIYSFITFLIVFLIYLLLIINGGAESHLKVTNHNLPGDMVNFYDQDLFVIIGQQFLCSYLFFYSLSFVNLIACFGGLLVFYVLVLTLAYGRSAFYHFIKTFQRDLWQIRV